MKFRLPILGDPYSTLRRWGAEVRGREVYGPDDFLWESWDPTLSAVTGTIASYQMGACVFMKPPGGRIMFWHLDCTATTSAGFGAKIRFSLPPDVIIDGAGQVGVGAGRDVTAGATASEILVVVNETLQNGAEDILTVTRAGATNFSSSSSWEILLQGFLRVLP